MKRIFSLAILFLLLSARVTFAGLMDYPTVAVLPFANKGIVSKGMGIEDAQLVSEFVIEDMLDSGLFDIIEREQLDQVLAEQAFGSSGLVDASTAPQAGQLLGAQYIVYGNVTGLTTKESGASAMGMGASAGVQKHKVTANISARIIEVSTGRVVLAGRGTGESSSSNFEFAIKKTYMTPYSGLNIDWKKGTVRYGTGANVAQVDTMKITIGTTEVAMVQVHNAISKAVYDLVYGKERGLVTKIKGEAKVQRRK